VPRRKIRRPVVAGLFYPANPDQLRDEVRGYLDQAGQEQERHPPAQTHSGSGASSHPKALIAPHAGYVYSGLTAAHAFVTLAEQAEQIKRVILLGPSHQVAFSGLATTGVDAMATPLGEVSVDRDACEMIEEKFDCVQHLEEAHAGEHSLEVELPFLQVVLGDHFSVVPIVVGDATAYPISQVIDSLWGHDETVIVVSSDLSHYQDYELANRLDRTTAEAIQSLRPEAVSAHGACGHKPIQGLLTTAAHHHLKVVTLHLCNSGDTAGPRDRVVGYGAFSFA